MLIEPTTAELQCLVRIHCPHHGHRGSASGFCGDNGCQQSPGAHQDQHERHRQLLAWSTASVTEDQGLPTEKEAKRQNCLTATYAAKRLPLKSRRKCRTQGTQMRSSCSRRW
ncbi:Polyamine Deacetylase Hdac10 [Manis pentadactyla]|nr:Polyamine Deacetylase Hdac10 [Manis pentadactyla]